MSGIHADNFDIYGGNVALMTNGRYSSVGAAAIVNDPDGVSVPQVIVFNGNGGMRRALKVPTNKVGIGMRIWLSSLPSDDAMRPTPCIWSDASNTNMFYFKVNTTGSISAYVWDTTSGAFGNPYLIGTTPGPVITANAWWQIEAYFDGAALEFELRVEGVPKLTLDSTDFAGHLHNGPNVYQCSFGSAANFIGASINTYCKDYFWWDGLGSENNTFRGSCLVFASRPDGDVDIGGWVPSTGTDAWPILDTTTPGSTPYVAAGIPPVDPLIMSQTDLPPDITSIKFLVTVVRAAKVDGGDGNLQVSLLSGGDIADGEDRPITAAQTYWEDVCELDPHTSAPWVPAAFDASDIQLNRTV